MDRCRAIFHEANSAVRIPRVPAGLELSRTEFPDVRPGRTWAAWHLVLFAGCESAAGCLGCANFLRLALPACADAGKARKWLDRLPIPPQREPGSLSIPTHGSLG